MRWFHRRRKVDARDMQIIEIKGAARDVQIIEIQGAMLSPPRIVGKMFVQPPTFPKGTVTIVKNLKGVLFVEDESE